MGLTPLGSRLHEGGAPLGMKRREVQLHSVPPWGCGETADTPGLGPGARKSVEVQVPPSPPLAEGSQRWFPVGSDPPLSVVRGKGCSRRGNQGVQIPPLREVCHLEPSGRTLEANLTANTTSCACSSADKSARLLPVVSGVQISPGVLGCKPHHGVVGFVRSFMSL